jgi:hypothetical protein
MKKTFINYDDLGVYELEQLWKSGDEEAGARLTSRFMLGMLYWNEKARMHKLLHPLFFLAGFALAAYLF